MARKPSLKLVGSPSVKPEPVLPKDKRDAIAIMAAVMRAQYEALVAEGFTASQALSIVKEQMK